MVLPFPDVGGAVPGHREFQDVRPCCRVDLRCGPGSITELASINLKREAFEKWRTGYLLGLRNHPLRHRLRGVANIYVKALNKVKQR